MPSSFSPPECLAVEPAQHRPQRHDADPDAGKKIPPEAPRLLLFSLSYRRAGDGEDLLALSHREIAKRVAFVAQQVPDTQMTVHDMVMLGRRPYMTWGVTEHDHDVVHDAMRYLNLENMRGRFLNQLSGGERQKVMLARALAQEPALLLLDEPTSNLDIRNQYQVLQITRDLCREQDLTAMIVIHDLNLALRFCDRFLLLREGEVYRYGGAEIFDADALRDVYGVRGSIVQVQGQSLVLIEDEEKEKLS